MSTRALADAVLEAFAASDLDAVERLVAPDATVWGTDEGEHWSDRASLVAALDEMRPLELSARWREPPLVGDGWAAGFALYRAGGGPPMETRVTLAFRDGRLVHGHFSVATTSELAPS